VDSKPGPSRPTFVTDAVVQIYELLAKIIIRSEHFDASGTSTARREKMDLSPPFRILSVKKVVLILILLVLKNGGYPGPDPSHSINTTKAEGKE